MLTTKTRIFTQTVLLIFFSIQLNSQSTIPVFPNLEGDVLLDEVAAEYTTQTVLDYGEARDTMYGAIYNVADYVTCIYSGHQVHLPAGVDPSVHVFMNGSSDGINAEHSYPRSKGADEDDGNGYSDLHHLFPARVAVNSARANLPFLEVNDNQAAAWFYLNEEETSIPTTDIDFYSEQSGAAFEPREDFKGNIARAIFYFFTIYKASALAADPDFFELQRETLCEWHNQDPVDLLEWERTYMIAAHQDDIPNPFILDASLANRSYCTTFALPVTLTSFDAFEKNGVVELNWKTATELNNHGFEIERRADNQRWETIHFVKGNGTTQTEQDYSFVDKSPLRGDNYYRLKQIDFDEKFEYSKILSVNIDGGENGWVDIYPNPNNGTFKLRLDHLTHQPTRIRLFDGIGNQLWAKEFMAEELTESWAKEFYFSARGIYFVVTEIDGVVQTQKVVIGE